MSVRQYIGARYVTKIYENSLDPSSAEWEAGVTYEPLTLVTYLNSSYLSKKDVPGSVGNPAANPDYWVVTGAYNGQILTLQNQIDTINNELAILGSKNALYIGNSYCSGVGSYDNLHGIYRLTNHIFTSSDLYTESGVGFVPYTGHTHTFDDLLTDAYNAMTAEERTALTDIICVSAMGDTRAFLEQATPSYTWLKTYIDDFIAHAKTYFPNARVSITLAEGVNEEGNVAAGTSFRAQYAIHDMFRRLACFADYTYMGWIGWPITHTASAFAADGYHPNDTGYQLLSNAFIDAYYGKYIPYIKYAKMSTALGGEVIATGTPDETVLRFLTWNTAGTWNSSIDLIDFTSEAVIPAGPMSTYCQHTFVYDDSGSPIFHRVVALMDSTGYKLRAGSSIGTLTSGNQHAIGEIVIPHTWQY